MFSDSAIWDSSPLSSLDEGHPESDLSRYQAVPSEIFENQDILGVIFEYFRDDETLETTRKQLLLAALTSKAFLEPAMISLWSSLDSFMPLLKLLPSFVLIDSVYVFTGIIAKGHWTRFDHYARRVKFLKLAPRSRNQTVTVSNHVYLRITQVWMSHSSSPLLPALQHLCIPDNFDRITGLSAAFLASSPSLESVELHAQATSNPEFFPSYLSFLIAERGSTLRCLVLRGNPRADSLILLKHLRNIHILEISFPQLSFSADLISTLTYLKCLSDLTMDFAPPPPTSQGQPISSSSKPMMKRGKKKGSGIEKALSSKLSHLRNLQITGSPTAVSHALDQLSAVNLTSIVVNTRAEPNGQPNSSVWLECFKGISRSPSISSIHIADTGQCSNCLSMSIIRPILMLSKLKELDIRVHSFTGGDDVIEEISSNLPILTTLVLPSNWAQPFLTARSLGMLSNNCTNLIVLKMAMDPKEIPLFQDNTSGVVCQRPQAHPLKSLYVSDTHPNWRSMTITQSIAISRYIDQLFPDLESMHKYGAVSSTDKCREMEELRSAFQTIRRASLGSVAAIPKPSYVCKGTQTGNGLDIVT